MTASRLPIPRKPLLPLSITSYSSLSLVVPSLIDASVKASSIVFADTSMYSTIFSPYLREFLDSVFKAKKLEVTIDIKVDEDNRNVDVELNGPEMGVLIGKRGQTLDSLQYLTNLAINKQSENYYRVKIDTEDYRKRRRETLENLAKNISFKVKRTKRPVSLEPMNPFERRVIHSALQNDRFVETHSEGDEPYRHVVVTLKK